MSTLGLNKPIRNGSKGIPIRKTSRFQPSFFIILLVKESTIRHGLSPCKIIERNDEIKNPFQRKRKIESFLAPIE